MPQRLRVGLLGAGHIGRFHAQTLAFKAPGAELAVIADVAEAAARELAEATRAPRWSADPQEVLADPAIDAVVIATPGPTHAALMAQAAAAGKHIFCEKPIALELPEIDAALAAVRQAGVTLQIGFQRRFDPGHVRAKAMIDAGAIGHVHLLHSRTRDPHLPPVEYLRGCGGLFRDTSVHDFDVVRWLAGSEVAELYAAGDVLIDPRVREAGDIDTATILLKMENGALATIDSSRQAVYGYDVRAEVFGAEGSLEVAQFHHTPVVHRSRGGVCHDHLYWYLERFGAAYEEELRAFVACARDGTPPRVTGEDGRRATLLGLAALRSLATGQPVRPADVERESAGA